MQLSDLVHSGAVCRSWHSAFATLRRLGIRSPLHPPCLLYASADDNVFRVCSPSTTGGHFRVPLLAADRRTGGCSPPTGTPTLTSSTHSPAPAPRSRRSRRSSASRAGRRPPGRRVRHFGCRPGAPDVRSIMARRARRWMYRRVAMSASPSAGAGCVVLLLHMPDQELSFARPGDERWTPLDDAIWASHGDGLFYDSSPSGDTVVHSLDLNGPPPSSPVATMLMFTTPPRVCNHHLKKFMCRYLAITPQHVAGGLVFLVVERRWRKSASDVNTTEMPLDFRPDDQYYYYEQVNLPGGVGDDLVLFLGHGGAACLRVEDYPMFRGNCAYLTDESDDDQPAVEAAGSCSVGVRREPLPREVDEAAGHVAAPSSMAR
uniref:KIB1-4 beta-propeller domain-containing protein n=1 Tax=Oryza punctata TaxID=4537 RepID=A0A0E0MGH1_ORYPU